MSLKALNILEIILLTLFGASIFAFENYNILPILIGVGYFTVSRMKLKKEGKYEDYYFFKEIKERPLRTFLYFVCTILFAMIVGFGFYAHTKYNWLKI